MQYKIKSKIYTVRQLLHERGIDDIDSYLNCDAMALESPFNLVNMEQGLELVHNLTKKPSPTVSITVDCDCDGFCSAAIMYLFLKKLIPQIAIDYKIHTAKQHGLEDMMEYYSQEMYDLIILPDSSSNDYDFHKELTGYGHKLLVLDHHEAEYLSPYATVINNQLSPNYANKFLCGAGVVYQFCRAYNEQYNTDCPVGEDLAGIAIVGDMMDLRPLENRYLVKTALTQLQAPVMKKFISEQSFSIKNIDKPTPTDIAFYVVPLINAMIRVGKQTEKEVLFEAFIDPYKALPSTKRGHKGEYEYAIDQAVRTCKNAKSRQTKLTDEATLKLIRKIEDEQLMDNAIITLLFDKESDINPSIRGLMAMKILAKYKKPVIVASLSDDCYKGSMRNNGQSELQDFKNYLNSTNLFNYVEGHPNSGGISIQVDSVDDFVHLSNEQLKHIDFAVDYYDVDFLFKANADYSSLIYEVEQLRDVWGKKIEEPIFCVEKIPLVPQQIQRIGANKDTIKFTHNGVTYIKFKDQSFIDRMPDETFYVTVIGRASVNEWNSTKTPQLLIDDYEFVEEDYEF